MSGVTAERSDVRNAERFVEFHGENVRFVGSWKSGLAWDGRRWTLDDSGAWERFAIATARAMLEEAFDEVRASAGIDDEGRAKAAKAAVAWAMRTQNATALTAMIKVARSHKAIAISHEDLDAKTMLFNAPNGTIELTEGRARAHRRADLLTKLAPVPFDPAARAPTWERFLSRAMAGDPELVDYLQRIIGYALTGDVREHVLAFLFGGGANGKSTFLATIHAMLGDYATPAPRGLLFRNRGERHPTELASLHGRRFVTCAEVEDGQAFDEALVKDLTGGDPISARRMRENFWPFKPTHKLFLAGNHKPTVRGDDEGIWRRMRLVPWTVTIPEAERDPLLPAKLRDELPGILAWAVRGCLLWQSKGLETPASVRDATSEYREESDTLGEFLRLHVAFEQGAAVARKTIREAYVAYCGENGCEPVGAKRFAGRLRGHGVRETSVREGTRVLDGWRGVRMATDAERATAASWRRRAEGTCSELVPIPRIAHTREETNRDSAPTSQYAPTSEETFADWTKRNGIGGGE